jgi:hypothetical protein
MDGPTTEASRALCLLVHVIRIFENSIHPTRQAALLFVLPVLVVLDLPHTQHNVEDSKACDKHAGKGCCLHEFGIGVALKKSKRGEVHHLG